MSSGYVQDLVGVGLGHWSGYMDSRGFNSSYALVGVVVGGVMYLVVFGRFVCAFGHSSMGGEASVIQVMLMCRG